MGQVLPHGWGPAHGAGSSLWDVGQGLVQENKVLPTGTRVQALEQESSPREQGPAQEWDRSSPQDEATSLCAMKPQRNRGGLSQPAAPRSTHLRCRRLTPLFLSVEMDREGQEHE